ncbi:phosphate/phosphite/phosphonate ABC transporter substrate-binding protein [Sulfurirhabdus autotrophica]|uniref:ABC-type phosphate/phosphonate transport system substrate-binding protein n=1 Tax=Sulfurirhabdus autotrophica TaxID=1706046 RepID=A0A4R3XYY9_9PROT|nr:phosphate/phosphite/phosphonate ABC transporter substrate-binding protein [Sulfurirhabdus autotrophica]TCV84327.1 ABC-type phosphate/phosphonate transport system substrate-binding protein [Sulfurirhabdus autotrophica]
MFKSILIRMFTLVIVLGSACPAWSADKKPSIEIGIAPFLPVKTLAQNYAPMRAYLEQRLKMPVTFVTAPDYKSFNERTGKHEYPLIITVANSAYLAWSEYGYIPLLRPVIYTRPVLVVSKNQNIASLKELRGKTIGMSDALAVVSMQGMQMLREAGLESGQDVTIKNMQNHGAAINLVIAGDVAAAIVSDRALIQLPAATQDSVKIIQTWERGAVPGIIYLGSPDLPREKIEALSQAILEYARDVPEGIALMKRLGYGGLAPIDLAELRTYEPYGVLLKEAMAKASSKQ